MANAVYPNAKDAAWGAGTVDLTNGTLKALLIDTADEAYNAADEFLSDITALGIVATSGVLDSVTLVNGLLDAADETVTGVTGDTVEAVVLFLDTGTSTTSRLIAFLDTGTGLPLTPNGGNVDLIWNASGIIQF